MLPYQNVSARTQRAPAEDFRKSHAFGFRNGVPVFESTAPGIGGKPVGTQKPKKPKNVASVTRAPEYKKVQEATGGAAAAASLGETVPAWVAFDRQVLRFDAYFKEAVHESRVEQYRVRRCIIYFYLEDDSMHIAEPKQENSGIPQGVFVKRHRIPKEDQDDDDDEDDYYGVDDLNIGREITIYGRTFRIYDCNQFTRHFLNKLGIEVPSPEELPEDPFGAHRKHAQEALRPARPPRPATDPLKQFLEFDRKVLRFQAYWDDSTELFGDKRSFTICFFLADETVEVVENIPANAGRDPFPKFIRRQRVPKHFSGTPAIGAPQTFLTDRDFVVGDPINLFGRTFVITSCDDATRKYYKDKFDVDVVPLPEEQYQAPVVQREIPPYTGFGSEEDSLASCVSLIPKAPKKNFVQLMSNDRKILRFAARLASRKPVDADRRFVVTYYLADNTISVFEPPQRNSGVGGGKFLERKKVTKPGSQEPYTAADLFIGAAVDFFGWKFVLIEADEFALSYMEQNAAQFPKSNVDLVLQDIRTRIAQSGLSLRQHFANMDTDGNGWLSYQEFSKAFRDIPSFANLSEQEILTLMRHFDPDRDGKVRYSELSSAVGDAVPQNLQVDLDYIQAKIRDTLKARGAHSIRGLGRSFRIMDDNGNKMLAAEEFSAALGEYGISLTDQELQGLLAHYDTNGDGNISYDEFLVGLRGSLNEKRQALVDRAWARFDNTGDGVVNLDDIQNAYDVSGHPAVVAGEMTPEEAYGEFITNFDVQTKDGIVTKEEFDKYFADISASVDNDEYFELMITNAWQLDR